MPANKPTESGNMTKVRRIMYVCTICEEHAPEGCGRFDRTDLRIIPDGRWVCDDCFNEILESDERGDREIDGGEDVEWQAWRDLPIPPEHKPSLWYRLRAALKSGVSS